MYIYIVHIHNIYFSENINQILFMQLWINGLVPHDYIYSHMNEEALYNTNIVTILSLACVWIFHEFDYAG